MTAAKSESLSRQFDATRQEIIANFRDRISHLKRNKLTKQELEELIDIFISRLESTNEQKSIEQLCKAEIALLEEGYPAASVAKNYLPKYRCAIDSAITQGRIALKDHNSHSYTYIKEGSEHLTTEHWALTYLKYDRASYEQFAETTTRNNNLKQDSLQPINRDLYLETVNLLFKSSDPRKLAIALAAVTGRRYSEVLARGHFGPTNHPYQISFSGQLKKRDAASGYTIFTLVPAIKVLTALNRFRTHPNIAALENDSIEEINKLNTSINRLLKKYFQDSHLVPVLSGEAGVTIQNLRSIYGEIAVNFFCPQNLGIHRFVQHKLGHLINDSELSKRKNSASTEHYFHYYLIDSGGKPLTSKGILLGKISLASSSQKSESQQNQISTHEQKQLEISPANFELLPNSDRSDRQGESRTSQSLFETDEVNVDSTLQEQETVELQQSPPSPETNPLLDITSPTSPDSGVFANGNAAAKAARVDGEGRFAERAGGNGSVESPVLQQSSAESKGLPATDPPARLLRCSTPASKSNGGMEYAPYTGAWNKLSKASPLDGYTDLKELVHEKKGLPPAPDSQVQSHPLTKFLTLINNLINSNDYQHLLIGLIGATGLDAVSLLKLLVFKRTAGSHLILYCQQLHPPHQSLQQLFTLLNADDVLKALVRLRLHPDAINFAHRLTGEEINCQVDEFIPDVLKNTGLKNYLDLVGQYQELIPFVLKEDIGDRLFSSFSADTKANFERWQQHFSADAEQTLNELMRLASQLINTDKPSSTTEFNPWLSVARLTDTVHLLTSKVLEQNERLMAVQYGNGTDSESSRPFHSAPTSLTPSFSTSVPAKTSASSPAFTKSASDSDSDSNSAISISPTADSALKSLSSEELKASRARGVSGEKLDRALNAIIDYNQQQSAPQQRWRINIRVLQQLTGCFYSSVKNFVALHQSEIDRHNQQFGLDTARHNGVHQGLDPNSSILW